MASFVVALLFNRIEVRSREVAENITDLEELSTIPVSSIPVSSTLSSDEAEDLASAPEVQEQSHQRSPVS
jgi:hypothetical protein